MQASKSKGLKGAKVVPIHALSNDDGERVLDEEPHDGDEAGDNSKEKTGEASDAQSSETPQTIGNILIRVKKVHLDLIEGSSVVPKLLFGYLQSLHTLRFMTGLQTILPMPIAWLFMSPIFDVIDMHVFGISTFLWSEGSFSGYRRGGVG